MAMVAGGRGCNAVEESHSLFTGDLAPARVALDACRIVPLIERVVPAAR